MSIIIRILLNAAAILIAAYAVPGILVASFYTALIVAVILGLLNIFVKPILVLLTLPITIITLGLFTLVINALLFWFVGTFVAGFSVDGFVPAFLGALIVAVVSWIGSRLTHD